MMHAASVLRMGRITFTADEQHEDIVGDVEAEDGVESQSEAVRQCIERYATLQNRVEELQHELVDSQAEYEDRIDALETEVERLHNEKRLILQEREEKQELATYVENQRSVEQQWREAGLLTRAKWKVFGMSSDESEA